MRMPRIALFSDSCQETGSVMRTALAIETCARRRSIPLLSVRTGPETRLVHDGSIVRLDLKRSSLASLGRGRDARFDLSMWRHIGRVAETASWFVKNRQRRETMGVAARARAVDLLSSERIFVDVCSARHAAMSEAEGAGRDRFALLPA
jgi:hypothetical protein